MARRPIPLYDKKGKFRLWWIGDHLWGPDMQWAAFIYERNAFSAKDSTWLGPVKRGIVMDRKGRVILWSPDIDVTGDVAPYRPAEPYRPPRPEKPVRPHMPPPPSRPPRPSGGWSKISLKQWIKGGPPEPKPDHDENENAGIQPDLITFDTDDEEEEGLLE